MMTETDALLDRLYRTGVDHDAIQSDRASMFLNITPATGQFLALLIGEMQPARILEIGTSNGYSTIWLARAAAEFEGRIVSIDQLPYKSTLARENLAAAGLVDGVDLVTGDAGAYLASCDDRSFSFLFLDASRSHYTKWWYEIRRVIDWGILVVDNAISHADEMRDLIGLIRSDTHLNYSILPIGKGQLVVAPAHAASSVAGI